MIQINERFRVIDGWIVDTVNRKVVSQKYIRSIFTPDEKRRLSEIKDLKVFKSIGTDSTVIKYSLSKELFSYLNTEPVEFVLLPERTVTKNSKAHKKAKRSVINEFTLTCHPVALVARNKCYLCFKDPTETTGSASSLWKVPDQINAKDNTIFTKIIKVQEFNFTQKDYKILRRCAKKNDNSSKQQAGDMLKLSKASASKNAVGYMGRDFKVGFTSFIKDLYPATLAQYGSRISFSLLMLERCDKLSLFENHNDTAKTVVARLRECQTSSQKAEAVGKLVSGLSEGTGDTEFWMKVVFLGAFEFGLWGDYKKICPCVSLLKYRRFLDSMMWLFK